MKSLHLRAVRKILSHPVVDIVGVVAVTLLFVGVFLFRETTMEPPIEGMISEGENTFSFPDETPKSEITFSDDGFSETDYHVTFKKEQKNAIVTIKNATEGTMRLSLVSTPLEQALNDPPVVIPSNSSAPYILNNEGVYTIINSDDPDQRLDITVTKEK